MGAKFPGQCPKKVGLGLTENYVNNKYFVLFNHYTEYLLSVSYLQLIVIFLFLIVFSFNS